MPCPGQELWEASPPASGTCGRCVIGLASSGRAYRRQFRLWHFRANLVYPLPCGRGACGSHGQPGFRPVSVRHPAAGASVQCGRQRCRLALPLRAPAGGQKERRPESLACPWREPERMDAPDRRRQSSLQGKSIRHRFPPVAPRVYPILSRRPVLFCAIRAR